MYSKLENEINQLNDEICALSEVAFIQCTLCDGCAGSCTEGINMPSVMRAIRAMAETAGVAPKEVDTQMVEQKIEK
jgi:heterodisulfide reductase subunit C